MEKRTPHCPLWRVHALLHEGNIRPTQSALRSAAVLGLDIYEMVAVVRNLSRSDFYKSMITHHDNRIWQDVYHPVTAAGRLYLKLMVIDDVLIVSFKEL